MVELWVLTEQDERPALFEKLSEDAQDDVAKYALAVDAESFLGNIGLPSLVMADGTVTSEHADTAVEITEDAVTLNGRTVLTGDKARKVYGQFSLS